MREKPATLAKLTRPKLFAVVARERLFQLLDDRLAHPIAWVTGPPGAGKTTLLSGYVESRQRPTLWYQLDSGDADIATFFYYLGVAAPALAEKPLCDGKPDAARSTGHQRDFLWGRGHRWSACG